MKCEKCGLPKPESGESAIGKRLCLCGAKISIENGIPTITESRFEAKKVDFWDEEGAEILHCEDRDEAIAMILDGEPLPFPENIKIVGYSRMKVTEDVSSEASAILDFVIERLDENYGNCIDGDPTDATKGMVEAAEKFISQIFKEYTPWRCEPVVDEIVNVKKWVVENEPKWITHDKVTFEEDIKLPHNPTA